MSIEEYRSPIFNFTEEELQSRKRIKGMLDFKIIYAKEDDSMSIEAIKKRFQRFEDTLVNPEVSTGEVMDAEHDFETNAFEDIQILLEQNQRLVEALEEIARRENPYSMISIAEDALQAYKLLEKKD